jgi:hypothetical protein
VIDFPVSTSGFPVIFVPVSFTTLPIYPRPANAIDADGGGKMLALVLLRSRPGDGTHG